MKKRLSLLLFLVGCIIIPGIFVKPATAQVTPDGTTNTTVDANGNDFTIQNGDRAGNNLFHSFQDFSVPTDGSAFFDNAADIANILSRVTGGNISNIDGLIRANGSANLFLINPAGIIFGQGARLDLGGSFYGSSASSILFEDGEFSATDLDNPPLLTINAPIGLGFRDEPGEITNRSFVQNSAEEVVGLEVDPGNNLAFIGGNINFEAGEATTQGGNIELGGLSEAGTVGINPDGSLSFPEEVTKADINLSNGADVDARGTGGGSVSVNARNLNLSAGEFGSSLIRAGIRPESTSVEAQAGDVTIDVAENITLDDSRITNQVDTGGVGNSGNITINTGSIEAVNGGDVDASTFGQGNAGSVDLNATRNITFDSEDSDGNPSGATTAVAPEAVGNAGGVTISTNNLTLSAGGRVDASTFSQGDAGSVNLTATGDIIIDGETLGGTPSGATSTVAQGAGNAGGVTISTNNLTLSAGGRVSASTFSEGNAGAVDIIATGDITIDGEDLGGIPSGATSQVNSDAEGDAGGVTISTTNLTLTAGGRVDASTFSQGDAGSVDLNATGDIIIDGEDSDGTPSGATSTVAQGAGNAGGVTISTNNLTLTNGGRVDASTFSQGDAGSVDLNATGDIIIDGETLGGTPSGATSTVAQGAGNAGGVTISTNNLTLTNGGRVIADTFSEGNAGSVDLNATGDITIDGETLGGIPSGATSQVNSDAVGNAGGVTLSTANLTLTNGGRVSASTFGQGNAGSVNITATESIFISGAIERFRSGISADALINNGNGGNVNVFTEQLTIANGGTIEASNFDNIGEFTPGTGQPGNILITANNLDLVDTARIEAATQSETGGGANINLQVADSITLEDNSFISAQAFNNANGGNLTIDTNFIVAFPSRAFSDGNDLVANAEQGIGGRINITAESLLGIEERTANVGNGTNDIDASSAFNLDGEVSIFTPNINVIQTEFESPSNPLESEQTVAQACQSDRSSGQTSNFTIEGKGGIPPQPTEPIDSDIILLNGKTTTPNPEVQSPDIPPLGTNMGNLPAELIKPTDSDAISLQGKTTTPKPQVQSLDIKPIKTSIGDILPAKGVIKTEDGQIILTAYPTDKIDTRTPHASANCK